MKTIIHEEKEQQLYVKLCYFQKGINLLVTVKVTFNIPDDQALLSITEKFLERTEIFRETDGLIRKNYICDIENSVAGGIYCFDTYKSDKEWCDDDRIRWLKERYSKPEIQYLENPVVVDNSTGEIIH